MIVLEFPPRAFLSSFVSAESLNGTSAFFPADKSAKATTATTTTTTTTIAAVAAVAMSLVA